MKWYYVFIKSIREQIRDYWILVLTLVFAPFFVFMYYLMSQTGTPVYDVVFFNRDQTIQVSGNTVNLGDSLVQSLEDYARNNQEVYLRFSSAESREEGINRLKEGNADAMVVLPKDLSPRFLNPDYQDVV